MSTDASTFHQIVETIFGAGSCTLNPATTDSNNVLGALASTSDFHAFRRNFLARLQRLNVAYESHDSRKALLTQVNLVGDPRNWQGAVAELAAYDLFNSKRNFLFESPKLDVSISPTESLGQHLGMQDTNLDIHFENFDVYSDVKVLKDNVAEILDGIRRQVWPDRKPLVQFEHAMDSGYELVQTKRAAILRTLTDAVSDGKKPLQIDCSADVPGLVVRLDWSRGLLITESSYSPFRHAEELHKLPFLHAKKFVTTRPFFLTFVVFPWFNNIITDFRNSNTIFYRSLARRAFCQYQTDGTPFRAWNPRYAGPETVSEVAKHLGGIYFVEDHSIEGDDPDKTNAKGFYYENPNAARRPGESLMDAYLHEVTTGDYDNFRHDNY